MNNTSTVFFGIFLTIALSWTGLILSSQMQYGGLEQISDENKLCFLPNQLSGESLQGKEVYRSLGCLYCHSQQTTHKGFRADYERGWGNRQSVPRDYILQKRVMLGTMRTGPDLINIGQRITIRDWHYLHLYDPDITSPGSIMPKYRYLFIEQKIKNRTISTGSLRIPIDYYYQPQTGYEIVPTDRVKQLVSYLLSLVINYELPEAKFITN